MTLISTVIKRLPAEILRKKIRMAKSPASTNPITKSQPGEKFSLQYLMVKISLKNPLAKIIYKKITKIVTLKNLIAENPTDKLIYHSKF